jgi:hypothetical protein
MLQALVVVVDGLVKRLLLSNYLAAHAIISPGLYLRVGASCVLTCTKYYW